MDIFECFYKGIPLHFSSATGMTSPAYYEEPGLQWLRSFYGGLLTTCGITYCGAPSSDQGKELGLHGRISNAAAEGVSVDERWKDNEYVISLGGRMREAFVMGENLVLRRNITTQLGSKGLRITDVIENLGFSPQPLMMLYHMNFGFPLLSENSRIIIPAASTEPRDEQSAADNGVRDCLSFRNRTAGMRRRFSFTSLRQLRTTGLLPLW